MLLTLFVLLVNLLAERPLLQSFLFALALAVGPTPELLPMIVTVTLGHGAIRMAREKVIVKRLSAIHDLGGIDVLCCDKTGTLTEARIKLIRELDLDGKDSPEVLHLAHLNSLFETGSGARWTRRSSIAAVSIPKAGPSSTRCRLTLSDAGSRFCSNAMASDSLSSRARLRMS